MKLTPSQVASVERLSAEIETFIKNVNESDMPKMAALHTMHIGVVTAELFRDVFAIALAASAEPKKSSFDTAEPADALSSIAAHRVVINQLCLDMQKANERLRAVENVAHPPVNFQPWYDEFDKRIRSLAVVCEGLNSAIRELKEQGE